MRKISVAFVILLLLAIVGLQVLAALNIFPRCGWVNVCPVNAISMKSGKAVIDARKCIGCRRCVAGQAVPYRPAGDLAVLPASPERSKSRIASSSPGVADISAKSGKPAGISSAQTKPSAPAALQTLAGPFNVDPDQCIGCGLCTIYCPEQAITMVGDKAVIDPSKCTDCGICKQGDGQEFSGCPTQAISGP